MSDAAARSKSVRLALAVAAVLIALGALTWWMQRGERAGSDVTIESRAIPRTEAAGFELAAQASDAETEPAPTRTPSVDVSGTRAQPSKKAVGQIFATIKSNDESRGVTDGWVYLFDPDKLDRALTEHLAHRAAGAESAKAAIIPQGLVYIENVAAGQWRMVVDAAGFEPAEQLVEVRAGEVTKVEVRVGAITPVARLTLVLRHPNGLPLFSVLEGADLEMAQTLRPVFVEDCPVVGAELPANASLLPQTSRDVRHMYPDQWMVALLRKRSSGCACVVLGNRVLDAVPFVAGQELVVLRVAPEALRVARASLLLRLRDSVLDTPLANVTLTVNDGFGGVRTLQTDALGTAVASDLLPTDVTVIVADERYLRVEHVVKLSSGARAEPPTLMLQRSTSIRGIVTFPAGEGPVASVLVRNSILVRRMNPPLSQPATVTLDASGGRGTFVVSGLPANEYLVGFASGPPYATPERVRSGEARGWKIVDTRPGNVDGVVIEVTKNLLDLVGGKR